MEKVNVGLIGVGRIGRLHAEHLAYRLPKANLVAMADIDGDAARKSAARLGVGIASEDPRSVLESKEIEAVVICSSTDTHASLIEQAAAAGKHIFCEKPIDLDLERIDRALQAVSDSGVKLQIGFNRRFDPSFRRVHEMVAEGQIGMPHILRITSRDPAPPPIGYVKVSGGIFLDMMIHDFDMARYLMDSEVTEVYAIGGVMVDPEIGQAGDVDTAVVTLQFANGALGTIDNSRKAVYGYDQRIEVFGSDGVATADNHTANRAVVSNAQGVHSALPLYFFIERYTEAYIAEMEAFLECVQNDKMPFVTGADGRAAAAIGYAAKRSLQEGRPVSLEKIGSSRQGAT